MKALLVVPRYVDRSGQSYEFPLGLAYISSALKSKGFTVEGLNLNHSDAAPEKLIQEAVIKSEIDVVLTGGLSIHYLQIEQILAAAKKFPKMRTVLGGGILSSNPSLVFEALKPDYGVLFEGEETIVELAKTFENNKDVSEVKGLIYWQNSRPVVTDAREPIADLDSICWPDYVGLEASKYLDSQMTNDSHYYYPFDYPRVLPMIASRSCPFNCTFCFHPLGNKYRVRSLNDFFGELEQLKEKFNLNMVTVYDELFGYSGERLNDFCSRMKATGLKWTAQIRVGTKLNDDSMNMLKESGLVCLGFGLESACDRVLESMKKHTTVQQMEHILALTQKHKIGIQGNFIFGDIAETEETARETIDWYKRHRSYQIALTPIYAYLGTEFYQIAKEKGLIHDELEFQKTKYPLVNVSKLSNSQYSELLKQLIELNIETRRMGKAQILKMKKASSSNKGVIYDLTVRCPFCKSINHFARFNIDSLTDLDSEGSQTACRICNQRITIFVPSIFSVIFSRLPVPLYHNASRVKRKILQKI